MLASEPADALMEPLYAELRGWKPARAGSVTTASRRRARGALGRTSRRGFRRRRRRWRSPRSPPRRRLELWRERRRRVRLRRFWKAPGAVTTSGERYDAMLVSID